MESEPRPRSGRGFRGAGRTERTERAGTPGAQIEVAGGSGRWGARRVEARRAGTAEVFCALFFKKGPPGGPPEASPLGGLGGVKRGGRPGGGPLAPHGCGGVSRRVGPAARGARAAPPSRAAWIPERRPGWPARRGGPVRRPRPVARVTRGPLAGRRKPAEMPRRGDGAPPNSRQAAKTGEPWMATTAFRRSRRHGARPFWEPPRQEATNGSGHRSLESRSEAQAPGASVPRLRGECAKGRAVRVGERGVPKRSEEGAAASAERAGGRRALCRPASAQGATGPPRLLRVAGRRRGRRSARRLRAWLLLGEWPIGGAGRPVGVVRLRLFGDPQEPCPGPSWSGVECSSRGGRLVNECSQ